MSNKSKVVSMKYDSIGMDSGAEFFYDFKEQMESANVAFFEDVLNEDGSSDFCSGYFVPLANKQAAKELINTYKEKVKELESKDNLSSEEEKEYAHIGNNLISELSPLNGFWFGVDYKHVSKKDVESIKKPLAKLNINIAVKGDSVVFSDKSVALYPEGSTVIRETGTQVDKLPEAKASIKSVAEDLQDLNGYTLSKGDESFEIEYVSCDPDEETIIIRGILNSKKVKLYGIDSLVKKLNDDWKFEDADEHDRLSGVVNNAENELEEEEREREEAEDNDEYGNEKAVILVMDGYSDDIRIYKNYSGRGMYGRKCFGIVVSGRDHEFAKDFEKLGVKPNQDSMGLDVILYWPRFTYEDMIAADPNFASRYNQEDDEEEEESTATANTYDDFMSSYERTVEKLLNKLHANSLKFNELTDEQWAQIEKKMRKYDDNVGEAIQHWMIRSGVTVREVAQLAIENQNKYGTEVKQIVNALEDFIDSLGLFVDLDEAKAAVDLRCPNCQDNLGKDVENSNPAYCGNCGKDDIKNPRGYKEGAEGSKYGDVKGQEPADKDIQRIKDIQDKAKGDETKMLKLAQNMANTLGVSPDSVDKAIRRAKACEIVYPGALGKKMAKIFMDIAVEQKSAASSRADEKEFIEYFRSFYDPKHRDPLYPDMIGAGWTDKDIIESIKKRGTQFEGDSFDREAIRDMLIEKYGEGEKTTAALDAKAQKKYDALKMIVDEHQYAKVDGVTVDALTAGLLCQILDALNEENRKKFLAMPVKEMTKIAWRMPKSTAETKNESYGFYYTAKSVFHLNDEEIKDLFHKAEILLAKKLGVTEKIAGAILDFKDGRYLADEMTHFVNMKKRASNKELLKALDQASDRMLKGLKKLVKENMEDLEEYISATASKMSELDADIRSKFENVDERKLLRLCKTLGGDCDKADKESLIDSIIAHISDQLKSGAIKNVEEFYEKCECLKKEYVIKDIDEGLYYFDREEDGMDWTDDVKKATKYKSIDEAKRSIRHFEKDIPSWDHNTEIVEAMVTDFLP